MNRPVSTPRIDWVNVATWASIPFISIGLWSLLYLCGRWLLGMIGS